MKKVLLTLSFLGLLACEEELDYQIPDPGSKVVIDAVLIADSSVFVILSQSVYSMSEASPYTRSDFDAVLITEGDSSIPLQLVERGSEYEPRWAYQSDHKLVSGQLYHLKASAPKLSEAQATVRIPQKPAFKKIEWDSTAKELHFEIDDPARAGDVYQITCVNKDNYAITYSTVDLRMEFFGGYDFLGSELEGRAFGNYAFIRDQNISGSNKKFTIRLEQFGGISPGEIFKIRLNKVSEDFYRHVRSISAYNNSDGIFSEPVQIYSNIDNGYGIVGTKAITELNFTF